MLYIHYMHWKCLHFINLPRTQYVSVAAPASLAGHLQQEGLVAICPYPMTARTHALPPTEQPMQSVNKVPRLYRMNRWCSECDTQQRQQRLWVAKHFLVPLGRNLHPVLVGDDPATATHIFIISISNSHAIYPGKKLQCYRNCCYRRHSSPTRFVPSTSIKPRHLILLTKPPWWALYHISSSAQLRTVSSSLGL